MAPPQIPLVARFVTASPRRVAPLTPSGTGLPLVPGAFGLHGGRQP